MNFIYNIGIGAYSLAVKAAALRNPKAAKMIRGQREAWRYLASKIGDSSGWIWIHNASLGEFEQGRPLIDRIRREYPERRILLTFFSPSGYEIRHDYPHVDAVAYLPFDTPGNVRRFLDTVRPAMAIFVKYEFWGNYLQELSRRNIPTYIISAIFRPSQVFFKPWGFMFRGMLRCYDCLYLQDEASRRLLEGIGVTRTVVAGDTRFDRVTDVMARRCDVPGLEQLSPFIVFGSSLPSDEERYMQWLAERGDVKFILAPHEFDAERISRLVAECGSGVVTLSQWEAMIASGEPVEQVSERVRGIVVDCFGKLSSLYRYGRVAYIGGGFGAGIHNINEAAVYGIPVVIGPNYGKFREACDLTERGGAFAVATQAELTDTLDRLLADVAARDKAGAVAAAYIRDNIGATDRIFSDFFGVK